MEGLLVLSNIAIILLIGLLATLISRKLKISNVLSLVLCGIMLQFFVVNGKQVFQFSSGFLIGVATLAIVMIVFDSTSRFRWKELDEIYIKSLKLTGWFTLVNIIVLSFASMLLIFGTMSVNTYLYGMIFAAVMIATDPTSLFSMMGTVKNKVINLLEIEALINTPLTVILPFMMLELVVSFGEVDIISSFLSQIIPFFQQIIVGLGSGFFVGIIFFKFMKNVYSEQLSPVGLITAALLSYIVSENMGGSGVLAVATLGLFFGSIYVKQKSTLQEFSSMLSNSLEMMVFILIGLMITLPWDIGFYVRAISLFIILLACRGISVYIALGRDGFTNKQMLFATLNMPKGIAMAVVVFSFSILGDSMLHDTLNYMLVVLLLTLILSTVVTRMSKKFINVDIHKEMAKEEKTV